MHYYNWDIFNSEADLYKIKSDKWSYGYNPDLYNPNAKKKLLMASSLSFYCVKDTNE